MSSTLVDKTEFRAADVSDAWNDKGGKYLAFKPADEG